MNKDIKFFDTSALLRVSEEDLLKEEKILISSATFNAYNNSIPFLFDYPGNYEVIDSESKERDKELQDAIFANDNIYIDEVILVSAKEERLARAAAHFGDAMLILVK